MFFQTARFLREATGEGEFPAAAPSQSAELFEEAQLYRLWRALAHARFLLQKQRQSAPTEAQGPWLPRQGVKVDGCWRSFVSRRSRVVPLAQQTHAKGWLRKKAKVWGFDMELHHKRLKSRLSLKGASEIDSRTCSTEVEDRSYGILKGHNRMCHYRNTMSWPISLMAHQYKTYANHVLKDNAWRIIFWTRIQIFEINTAIHFRLSICILLLQISLQLENISTALSNTKQWWLTSFRICCSLSGRVKANCLSYLLRAILSHCQIVSIMRSSNILSTEQIINPSVITQLITLWNLYALMLIFFL